MSEPTPLEAIFFAALERAPAERAAYLDSACADDADLRRRVERMLTAQLDGGSFLESPPSVVGNGARPTVEQSPLEKPGTQIGPYKILQQIGEGGMGTVFMAEQTEPVQRRVALKIIKPGMDSRQVVARFAAEKQALALMDHVNIARVLDAGVTEQGRPYFVMELVHGVPITKYCDDNHLTPRQRLELFVPVCQAIQHAHQKGIIHRDIKPSNVMVTLYDGKPVPKVIDFGVAKAMDQKLTEQTLFTQYGTMVGTLEYMSPEQAEMSALGIDTRSDIYSLGVLLYELLTGSTPLSRQQMKEAAYGEILRLIRDVEPPKPSTRLSESGESLASISAQRHTEPAKLSKLMRGELDWIVMKTLEKDRNRRYETANGFAMDVQRYLADEPVLACPPSAAYRFRKFARRNKRALATMTVLILAVLSVAGTLGWAVRDRDARAQELVRERADLAQEATRDRVAREAAIQGEVSLALKEAEQWQQQAKWPEALSAAKRAEGLLAGSGGKELRERVRQFRNDLDVVLRLEKFRAQRGNLPDHQGKNRAYARLFVDLGIDVEKLSPPEIAARIARRPTTAVRLAAALDDWSQILRDWALHDPTRDPETWQRLLEAAQLADPDPWRRQLRQLMGQKDLPALQKLADGADMPALPIQSLQLMGNGLAFGGDGAACVAWLRKAHRQHPSDALVSFDLSYHLSQLPSPDIAESLRFAEASLAAQPSAYMYDVVGNLLCKLGRNEEAAGLFRKAIELDLEFDWSHSSLGHALRASGKLDEAIACYQKAIQVNPNWSWAYHYLGSIFDEQDKLAESVADYREAIRLNPSDHPSYAGLGFVLMRQGDVDGAIDCYRNAIGLQPDFAWAHNQLGSALARNKDFPGAIAACSKGIELKPNEAAYWRNRGSLYAQMGQPDEAIADYSQTIELHPDDAGSWYLRALLLLQRDDTSDYRQACARMLGRFEQSTNADITYWTTWCCVLGPDALADWTKLLKQAERAHAADSKSYDTINQLGCVLYRAGRFQEAAVRLAEADAVFTQTPSTRSAVVYNWLFQAMAHHRLGRTAEAVRWLEKALHEIDEASPKTAKDSPTTAWNRQLTLKLLRHEAEELLAKEDE